MISKKGKRKLVYNDSVYYWFVRVNEKGHRLYIMSEDKKVRLDFSFWDTEVPITPGVVAQYLEEYYKKEDKKENK